MSHPVRSAGPALLLAVPAGALAAGLLLSGLGRAGEARLLWSAAALVVLAALLVEIVQSLRQGRFGLDILAALSMASAVAVGEALAAAVVALMYSGGTFLEARAEARARRELTALLQNAPRRAALYRDGGVVEVAPEAIRPGDRLLVRRGDVVAVDGTVAAGRALLDASALTGEAELARVETGGAVMSGSVNAGDAFDLEAASAADESTYAGILRLVEAAQAARAPMARLADRYALGFLALALALAGAAWWAAGDPVRAVAVLVIATPCPLILAVPVAMVAGLSRAAAAGVLVKGADALERLAGIRTVILDKTGTLTEGRPRLLAVEPLPGCPLPADELLRLAAALETASPHPMAAALVASARDRGLALPAPEAVEESPGEGLAGRVAGHAVLVGGRDFVFGRLGLAPPASALQAGEVEVALALDGAPAGLLRLADRLRPGTDRLLERLRALGVGRLLLATGDRAEVAAAVAGHLAFDATHAGLAPADKAALVRREAAAGPVLMAGDGVNDAPALALAEVGVAMGARGAAASAETADVVILADRLDPLVAAVAIARHTKVIALQSVYVGIGLSVAGMLAAAMGWLTPVEGALLQEAIDVAAILNALTVLVRRPPGLPAPHAPAAGAEAEAG